MQLLKGHYSTRHSSSFSKKPSMMPTILRKLAQKNCLSLLPKLKSESPSPSKLNLFDSLDNDSPLIEPEALHPIVLEQHQSPRKVPNFFFDLPKMNDIGMGELVDLMSKKFELCSFSCDFLDQRQSNQQLIDIKSQALIELINSFDQDFCLIWTNDSIKEKFNQMVIANLSRTIYLKKEVVATLGETSSIVDPQWPHLALVYELLSRYLRTFNGEAFINHKLLHILIALLDSPDIKEREAIYVFITIFVDVFPDRINSIYKCIFFLIAHYVEDSTYVFCISYSLLFLTKYSSSLEYSFTYNYNEAVVTILSLISGEHLPLYANELLNFIDVILKKRKKLLRIIIIKFIRRFPITNVSHQSTVLAMINHLIVNISAPHFKYLVSPLFSLYGQCAISASAKTAEISFQIWTIKEIVPYLSECSGIIFPLLYPNIVKALNGPNGIKLRPCAINVLQTMQSLNSTLFEKLSTMKETKKTINAERWKGILELASENYKDDFSLEQLDKQIKETSRFPTIVFK